MEMHNPPHPGESLKKLYMEPLKLTIQAVAERLGVERKAVSRLVNGHGGISAEMAIRLGKAFNTSPDLWLNKQRNYDLWHAKQRMRREAARIKPFSHETFVHA
jgi:antitoxin HigA-1